jgi:hypothetical protein
MREAIRGHHQRSTYEVIIEHLAQLTRAAIRGHQHALGDAITHLARDLARRGRPSEVISMHSEMQSRTWPAISLGVGGRRANVTAGMDEREHCGKRGTMIAPRVHHAKCRMKTQ